MKLILCDLCKKIPAADEIFGRIVKLTQFEIGENILGIPKKTRVLCENCYQRLIEYVTTQVPYAGGAYFILDREKKKAVVENDQIMLGLIKEIEAALEK